MTEKDLKSIEKEDRKLNSSLLSTIFEVDLINIGKDIGEVLVDSKLVDGIVKNIPVLNILYSLGKTVGHVSNLIYAKKIHRFLYYLSDIPKEERIRFQEKHLKDEKSKHELGEQLLLIIDRLSNYTKIKFISLFFKVYIQEKIVLNEFIMFSDIIDKMSLCQIRDFCLDFNGGFSSNMNALNYSLVGLAELDFAPHSEGYGFRYVVTHNGSVFKQILANAI